MLPVYRAIQKVATLEGGTTKPWKVIVLRDNVPTPFVVKFFSTRSLETGRHVASEVFSNAIAADLELSVPEPALILMDDAFKETLTEDDQQFLETKDARIKFGCRYVEGSVPFTRRLGRNVLSRYDCENIYAFDNLVHNTDRKNGKPNILLHDDAYYLIDHELTISFNDLSIQNLRNGLSFYEHRLHVFYRHLRSARLETRRQYFESFELLLRCMRPEERLVSLKNQLTRYDQPVGDFETLIEYLNFVRHNPTIFTRILKNRIV